jgi:hypothetical protein
MNRENEHTLGCFPILSRPTPIHSTKPKSGRSPGQRHEEADGQCSGHACSLGQQIQRHNRQSESRKRDEGAGHDQDRLLGAVAALHDPADRHEGNGEQHGDPGDRAAHRLACRDDNGDERTRADRPQQEFAAICHSAQPLQWRSRGADQRKACDEERRIQPQAEPQVRRAAPRRS